MADRYDKTEYGGGEGTPNRGSEEELLPLKQIPGRIGDAARVLRQVGKRGDYDGVRDEVAYDKAAREDLEAKTNGYRKSAPGFGDRIA